MVELGAVAIQSMGLYLLLSYRSALFSSPPPPPSGSKGLLKEEEQAKLGRGPSVCVGWRGGGVFLLRFPLEELSPSEG